MTEVIKKHEAADHHDVQNQNGREHRQKSPAGDGKQFPFPAREKGNDYGQHDKAAAHIL